MAKTHSRINYAAQALYVGPTPATGGHYYSQNNPTAKVAEDPGVSGYNLILQLYRIQSVNFNYNVNRTPVHQFGELPAIDRPILEPSTVPLSFSYLLANMFNESGLGFHTQGLYNCVSGFLTKDQDDKNYFLKIVEEGREALNDTRSNSNNYTIGFGNGFITSYTSRAAVNAFPTVDVTVEAANVTFDTGISGTIPAIIPSNGARMTGFRYTLPTASGSHGTGFLDISVLRPGDITLSFRQRSAKDEGNLNAPTAAYSTAGVSIDDAHIQSYNLAFNLNRDAIQSLGSKFPHSREITFPVDVTLTVDALVTKLTTGSLSDIVNCDDSYDVTINLKNPICPGETQSVVARYILKNAKLNSQSYTSDIGGNQAVTLEFGGQIGGPSQTLLGLYMSGVSSATAT